MPPRHAYWTILIGQSPTAFRAREAEELRPTFERLREKHPEAVMKWFARGRLWDSPEQSREAGRRPEAPPEARTRDWRPGGAHRDPRDRFKRPRTMHPARAKKRQAWAESEGDRRRPNSPPGPPGRPSAGPKGLRPEARRPDRDRRKGAGGRPHGPAGDRPRGPARPQGPASRPHGPASARPRGPAGDRPRGPAHPQGPASRPRGPASARPGGPAGDRPRGPAHPHGPASRPRGPASARPRGPANRQFEGRGLAGPKRSEGRPAWSPRSDTRSTGGGGPDRQRSDRNPPGEPAAEKPREERQEQRRNADGTRLVKKVRR